MEYKLDDRKIDLKGRTVYEQCTNYGTIAKVFEFNLKGNFRREHKKCKL